MTTDHIPYCAFVDGEPAYCTAHAAKELGVPKQKLHDLARQPNPAFEPRDHAPSYRSGSDATAVDAERLACDLKWKGRCLWVLGEVMEYQDTHPIAN